MVSSMYISNYFTLTTFLRLFMSIKIQMRITVVPVSSAIFSVIFYLCDKRSLSAAVTTLPLVEQTTVTRFPSPVGEHLTSVCFVAYCSTSLTLDVFLSAIC